MNNKGIFLKNIDLTGISKNEQWEKMSEEESEFVEAYFDYENNKTESNKNHLMEEFLDTIQSALGVLEKEGIKAEEVQAYYNIWVKKLEKRPRKKRCSKCINKSECKLYLTEHWDGEKEAEFCKNYKEMED